jgi:hypothetical protein
MSEISRRKLLATTGAGAASAAGVVALGVSAADAAVPRKDRARDSVVAYVADHRRGEVRLFVGEEEILVHDKDLATRILNAAGGN